MSLPTTQAPTTAWLLRKAGIDRAVGFAVIGRAWSALAGLVTLVLMTRCLSPEQQGYYVTFGSVLATAVFFELGLALVLMQFASHERAGLDWTAAGTLDGDPAAKRRLASLLQMSVKWYAVIGAAFIAALLPLGLGFFGRHGSQTMNWQVPWIWIIGVSGASLALMSVVAVLEGCGLIAEIVRLQMWQNIAGSLLLWFALLHHWGLYAAPVTNTVSLVSTLLWLGLARRRLVLDLFQTPTQGASVSWRTEIWPLQWKIALSCVSGYFVFQLFNPILFATHGAAAAGQMGLSITVLVTVGAVAMSWVATKAATFGSLIARREFGRLDQLFFPCLWQSWGLVSVLAALVWAVDLALHRAGLPLSRRFLDPLPLGLLALVTVVNHGIGAEAIYLRAHKREPYLVMSLLSAGLVGLSALLLGKPFGATGMMLAYACIAPLSLGLATAIFIQKRHQWHRQESGE